MEGGRETPVFHPVPRIRFPPQLLDSFIALKEVVGLGMEWSVGGGGGRLDNSSTEVDCLRLPGCTSGSAVSKLMTKPSTCGRKEPKKNPPTHPPPSLSLPTSSWATGGPSPVLFETTIITGQLQCSRATFKLASPLSLPSEGCLIARHGPRS